MNMNNKEELTREKTPSRRRLVRGLGILSMLAAISALGGSRFRVRKNIIACAPESNKRTIRMLTEDGRLVEIEETRIPVSGKKGKISDRELQNWIKN